MVGRGGLRGSTAVATRLGNEADLERFQAMRIQDDKIIEIAAYPSRRRHAVRIAKRFAAQAAG